MEQYTSQIATLGTLIGQIGTLGTIYSSAAGIMSGVNKCHDANVRLAKANQNLNTFEAQIRTEMSANARMLSDALSSADGRLRTNVTMGNESDVLDRLVVAQLNASISQREHFALARYDTLLDEEAYAQGVQECDLTSHRRLLPNPTTVLYRKNYLLLLCRTAELMNSLGHLLTVLRDAVPRNVFVIVQTS